MNSVWIELIVLCGVYVALVASAPGHIATSFLPVAAIILYNRIDVIEHRKRFCND